MKRLEYIDKAKGILIILAVIGHIWQAGYVFDWIYAFHMPAFFCISGMLMRHIRSYEKPYPSFVLHRVYAFGIPFLFFELLGILTDIIRHGVTLNIKGYLYNTLTLHFNDPNLWFLMDLFLIELIFVAAKRFMKKDSLVVALCVLLVAISLLLPAERNEYIKTLASSFRNLIFFAGGFYGKALLEKRNTAAAIAALLLPVLVAGLFGHRAGWCLSLENAAFIVSGFAGTYAALQIGKLPLPAMLGRFLAAAGRNSIIIYGTHHIIYAAVGVCLGITDFAATPLWPGLIMLLVVAVVELPVIYIINRWLPFLAGKRYPKPTAVHN